VACDDRERSRHDPLRERLRLLRQRHWRSERGRDCVGVSTEQMFVVPCIEPPWDVPAVEHWDVGPELLVVDHTPDGLWQFLAGEKGWTYLRVGRNLGTAGAWNIARAIAIDTMRPGDLLTFLSCSCEFPRGLSEVRYAVRSRASWKGVQLAAPSGEGFAWHCMTLSVGFLDLIGTFDENLIHYWGDNDYCYRAIIDSHWCAGPDEIPTAVVDAVPPKSGKAIRSGRVPHFSMVELAAYFRAKWGGDAGAESFRTPFNLPVPTGWWSPLYRPTVYENGSIGELH
jgi:hypothetical protein